MIEHPDWHRVLGLRLRPAGAYALLSQPTCEVSGYTVDLPDLLGTAERELTDRCHAAATVEICFARTAAWVCDRVRRARSVDPAVAWSMSRIEQSGGRVPIAELRDHTGLSKTRLAALFRDQVGALPKVYARIVRFRRALALLDAEPASLAEAALDAGYYDQSPCMLHVYVPDCDATLARHGASVSSRCASPRRSRGAIARRAHATARATSGGSRRTSRTSARRSSCGA